MDKVIPRAINYSDIKPEAIENMVRVVRYTPTATVNNASAHDIIRFQLMGNGFFDPYSSYIRLEVTVSMSDLTVTEDNPFVGRFLDRSAHSFISRLVVKSQGTELERIEQYDVAAAMINDMLYSQEQTILHHYEGFPTKSIDMGALAFQSGYLAGGVNMGWAPLMFLPTLNQDLNMRYLIDQGFWKFFLLKSDTPLGASLGGLPISSTLFKYQPATTSGNTYVGGSAASFGDIDDIVKNSGYVSAVSDGTVVSPSTLVFCIPIYSGILGVLMPDKKMLPLSLMPLEVEFTLNPYALYTAGPTAQDSDQRDYTVTKFWIYSHLLSFEQELHRSLEAVVAQNGIFIHFNSFYLGPICTHVGNSVQNYAQINIHAKSINSVHFVFIYTGFESASGQRKLHFVNHNLAYLQLRNGTELVPSEAIQGDQLNYKPQGQHVQFLLETFKAFNKLHDPTTDAAISPYSYCTDELITRPVTFFQMVWQQSQLGRCQYAISLEGEELSQDRTIITGRKGLIPFDINMTSSTKSSDVTSFQYIFVKADYIIYVRPDLVVTLLGR